MRLAQRWAEPFGEVTAIDYRPTSPVTVGQDLTVTGEVVGDGPEPAAEVWVALAEGTRACHGRVAARRTA
ncbi:hypothetical protein [Streptomyces sp. NPDC058424]|uniref:hypothetical protein n=1 Tax=Streptomyces sp. NPDC058424 TaxID=3346491 RepID=UPI003654E0D3